MITQMKKYTFLVFHRDYEAFLEQLRSLGVVHITEKASGTAEDATLQSLLQQADRLRKTIAQGAPDQLLQEKANVESRIAATEKEAQAMAVWGDFSAKSIEKLQQAGYSLRFFVCPQKKFDAEWGTEVAVEKGQVYFVVVIDDRLMEISHVIRGDDHIANTPKQLMVYEALGWEAPEFGHMTLIINSETGKKLSKRDTNTLQFIEDYRKKGYMPEAVFNFIALLGWNPGGEDEIFSREELIKLFDENRLSKSPAAFDQKKMDWMSNEYIKNADFDTIFAMAKPFLEEAGRLTDKAEKLVELYKPQMKSVDEIIPSV